MSDSQHIEIQTSTGNVIQTNNLINNNTNVNNIISSVANNTSSLNTSNIQNSANAQNNNNNGKPRGKMTAYAFFVHTCRQELKNSRPNQNVVFGEFSKKCAAKWKELEPHNKKPFEEMAARDKQRWEQEVEQLNRQKQQQQAQLPPQQQIIQTTGPNGETIQQIVTIQPTDPQYQHSANQNNSGPGPSTQQQNTGGNQTGHTGKKKKNPQPKDPNAPKRPHSAFLLYCSDHRPVVKEQCPGARIGDIAKKLAAGWAKLDPQVKSHYEEASNQQKQRYKEEKEAYVKKKQQAALEEQQRRQEQHRLQQEQQRQQQQQQQQQFQHQQMNLNSLQQQQLSPVITRFDNNQNTYMNNGGQTIIQTNQHDLGGQPQTLAIIQNHNPGNGGSPRTYVQEVIQNQHGGQQIITNQPQYTRRAIIQDENGQQQVYIIQTPSNNHNQIQLSSNNGHRIIGGNIMSTNQHGQQIQIQGLGGNNNNNMNNNNSPLNNHNIGGLGNQIRVSQPQVKTIQRINHPHGNANSGGTSKPKKVKQIKDPNAPKRPHSAFLLYCAEHRPKLRQQFPGARIGDMAKKLGQNWANVDAKTKQYYEDLSNQQKARYAKEKEEYKANLAAGNSGNNNFSNNNNNNNNSNNFGNNSNIVSLKQNNSGRGQIQLQNAQVQELSEEHALIQGQDEEGNVHYIEQGEILSHEGLPTMADK